MQYFLATAMMATMLLATCVQAQVAVKGKRIHTMAGSVIEDGVVIIKKGKIQTIGKAADIKIPKDFEVLESNFVTPGLVDVHATVGLSGIYNSDHDQDQLETSEPVQPELRALDAYNAHDELVEWVRSFGVTTVHTGHAPGELISGQTIIVKTAGNTVEDAVLNHGKAVSVTLTSIARKTAAKSPGTRGKMISMLRSYFLRAQEYDKAITAAKDSDDSKQSPARDLKLEALVQVLNGKMQLMITADKAQDIASAIRLAKEFNVKIWLDSASEAYLLLDQIKQEQIPVLLHPSMIRPRGDRDNVSFETAAKLRRAQIPFAIQSGYEPYVPKTRVILFEAAIAAANGLTFEQALASITIDAANILGIQDRVGSIEIGKDGDLALYDGDPFEYASHCVGVIINGQVVSRGRKSAKNGLNRP